MDLRQNALLQKNGKHWKFLFREGRILKLIHYGFENVNISDNDTME